jgi:hypothetical protein
VESIFPETIEYERVYPASSYAITRAMDLPVKAFSGTEAADIEETTGGMPPTTALIFAITDEHNTGPSMPASQAEIERL